jgi:two-component system, chemotaxis family, protein-glutamate methylesterase/glutaminase
MHQATDAAFTSNESRLHAPQAVIIIGSSTGGPAALAQILPKFPRGFPASIIVVQQMRPGFTRLLASHLNGLSELAIEEARSAHLLTRGTALFAPGDCAVSIQRSHESTQMSTLTIQDVSNSIDMMRKRVDNAMITAALQFGSKTIGVLLTGVGDDGRMGMKAIREAGGKTIAQDELSSIVFDMPRSAIDAGVVDDILPLWSIADRLIEIVGEADASIL